MIYLWGIDHGSTWLASFMSTRHILESFCKRDTTQKTLLPECLWANILRVFLIDDWFGRLSSMWAMPPMDWLSWVNKESRLREPWGTSQQAALCNCLYLPYLSSCPNFSQGRCWFGTVHRSKDFLSKLPLGMITIET